MARSIHSFWRHGVARAALARLHVLDVLGDGLWHAQHSAEAQQECALLGIDGRIGKHLVDALAVDLARNAAVGQLDQVVMQVQRRAQMLEVFQFFTGKTPVLEAMAQEVTVEPDGACAQLSLEQYCVPLRDGLDLGRRHITYACAARETRQYLVVRGRQRVAA